MANYLVEAYTPAGASIDEIEARIRWAVDDPGADGAVSYFRSIFVPEDETSFHLLEGPSAQIVGSVLCAVGISVGRIVEAIPTEVR